MSLNLTNPKQIETSMAGRLSRRRLLKRSLALGLSAPVVAGLLAACGSGGGNSTSPAGNGASIATRTPTAGAGGGATTPAAGGTMTGGAMAGQMVEMNDQLKFAPASVTIKVGDTITWMNVGNIPHTTTADPAKAMTASNVALPSGAKTWDSGMLNGGQSFSHTFDVAGVYKYICIPHEAAGMLGTVTVQ